MTNPPGPSHAGLAGAGLAGACVLLVEDEAHLASSIAFNLEAEGAKVEVAVDGERGLQRLVESRFDLAVLDVMLPKLDGFALCRKARELGVTTPVLFLTARGDVRDRIRGLREGGDDYLAKPFHLEELLLRAAAVVKRSGGQSEPLKRLEFAGHVVDFLAHTAVLAGGEKVQLSGKELGILRLLVQRAGEVVTRDEILDRVWGLDAYPSARTIDNFVVRLRRRFEVDPESPRWLVTLRGVGYRWAGRPAGSGSPRHELEP